MRSYSLTFYECKLDRQVIHMDQGLSCCPEFRATRDMSDYPSRKMQLARAVFKGELQANEYIADILFRSILSRQGERWQYFSESAEDFTDLLILAREMLVERDCRKDLVQRIEQQLAINEGHLLHLSREVKNHWKECIPVCRDSSIYFFLDDATCEYAALAADHIGRFFRKLGITFFPEIEPHFGGWEYFVYGLVSVGIDHANQLVTTLAKRGVKVIVTLSGQSTYLWKHYFPKIGVRHPFQVQNIFDFVTKLKVYRKTYIYAGSFYTRYLGWTERLNRLIDTDFAANTLTIWEKPLTAEYELLNFPEVIREAIFQDGWREINRTPYEQLLVLEPYAYRELVQRGYMEKTVFFTNALC